MINCTNNKYESRTRTGDAVATWQKLWTKKEKKMEAVMRKASPTLCTARLCYAIVSKVHWPPSTANHKTREREREEGSLAANKTLPPSSRKVAARRRFANLCTYIIQHFKTKGKNRGKKMCSVDVTWRQRMLEARFHVLPPFRHLVCVTWYGWLWTEFRLCFSPRAQQQTWCTYTFTGWRNFSPLHWIQV